MEGGGENTSESHSLHRWGTPHGAAAEPTYLDDIRDKRNDIRELSHIDIEVTQLISTGFCHDNLTAISDGGQTAKVARGIELRVGGPRHGDAGNGTRRERSQRGTRAAHGARSASRSAVHDASACVDGSNVAR